MHATKVLQKILSSVIARRDARNVRALFFAVEALLTRRRLTLTELARHFPGAERTTTSLKRFDRLLGNHAVQAMRASFYQAALICKEYRHMKNAILQLQTGAILRKIVHTNPR